MNKKGLFITFEGVEGSGKTTQINLLSSYFKEQGKDVTVTLEPGGSSLGKTLRKMLLNKNQVFHNLKTELLLFYADRCEHISEIIEPALQKNHVVICDRYIDSSYAYQAGGRQLKKLWINNLNSMIEKTPDLTFLLDLPVEIGLKRAEKRANLDRFEKESLQFHNRVRNGFLEISKTNSRIKIINANNKHPQEISIEIQQYLKELDI
ncbi:dTMP kinase [Candidatus Marinamargulisbacteria bacterium SCGC AG-410-N11]|nr:dTMP kinase [Candidatus Marinamargulisbacteria bacterium SCGC AG-410-N11]